MEAADDLGAVRLSAVALQVNRQFPGETTMERRQQRAAARTQAAVTTSDIKLGKAERAILTVLVQNAINHGRLPGEIARVTVAVEVREGRPAIEVTDRGPGIPEAVASQIGRPFFTTSEYGTGLGLYIARELAKANGATLDYVSVPGGGACFRLVLSGRNPLLSA